MIGENIYSVVALGITSKGNEQTATGTILANSGYNSAAFLVFTGSATGSPTAVSVAYKLQHGDASDGSDMTDVPGASGTITAENRVSELNVVTSGLKSYVRVVCTVTLTGGTSPSITLGAIACFEGKYLPA